MLNKLFCFVCLFVSLLVKVTNLNSTKRSDLNIVNIANESDYRQLALEAQGEQATKLREVLDDYLAITP